MNDPSGELRVRDRMSAPALTAGPDSTTAETEGLLAARSLSAVPIVDRSGSLVGIVSRTDLLRAPRDSTRPCAALMTPDVVAVRPEERLEDAVWRMVALRVHRLVVATETEVVGILSTQDVLDRAMRRPLDETLESVMRTPPERVSIGAPLGHAVERLVRAAVHGLVVVDGSTPVGVFTQREALAARRLPRWLQDRPVEELMRWDAPRLDLSTPVRHAAERALMTRAARILVTEGKYLVGVVSGLDLLSASVHDLTPARALLPIHSLEWP